MIALIIASVTEASAAVTLAVATIILLAVEEAA